MRGMISVSRSARHLGRSSGLRDPESKVVKLAQAQIDINHVGGGQVRRRSNRHNSSREPPAFPSEKRFFEGGKNGAAQTYSRVSPCLVSWLEIISVQRTQNELCKCQNRTRRMTT